MFAPLLAASLLLHTAAAAPATDGASIEGAADAAVAPATASQEALLQALSARDAGPDCAVLSAMSPTPVVDLTWIALNAPMPPWAGMRAAECLITAHHAAAMPTLRAWVTDPQLAGFGILVLNKLDALPLDTAKELATLALSQGPDVEKARKRIARSKVPEIQALSGLPAK